MRLNPHRHLGARNVHLPGITNHPFTGCSPSLELLERWAGRFPLERLVTHQFPLEGAEEALAVAQGRECLEVAIVPREPAG